MKLPFKDLDHDAYLRLAGTALWFALFLWLASLAFVSIYYGWGNDMRHFWGGARTLIEGHDPYVAIMPYPYLRLAPGEQFHPLPWVGLLFAPLASLPFQSAVRVWAALNWLLILASIFLIRQHNQSLPPWSTALIAMTVVLMEIRSLQSAQLGILVTVAILSCLACLSSGRSFVAGALLSIGIFKPWIAAAPMGAAILIALKRRKPRLLTGFLVGTGIIVLASTLLWPSWLSSYPKVDFSQALGYKVGDTFLEMWPLATLFDFTKYILHWPQTSSLVILQVAVLGLAVGWIAFETLRKWRAKQVEDRFLVGVSALIPLVAMPYVRYYDYAILACWWGLVAPALVLSHALSPGRRALVLGLMVLGLSFLFGTHLEPWVYQLVACLYAATVVGLASLESARGSGAPLPPATDAPRP